MIIPAKQFIEEMTKDMNKLLAEMPDDETRQAVLDAFSKQMFCETKKGTREMKGEYKVCSLEDADVFARKRALGKGPLSEEEINKLYLEHGNSEWGWQIKFARAIEERHGIK